MTAFLSTNIVTLAFEMPTSHKLPCVSYSLYSHIETIFKFTFNNSVFSQMT